MTRPVQKKRERFFVEETARLLGKTWELGDDREHPDFIVVENRQRFGLEVTQIFIGPQDDAGSSLKASESKMQRTLNGLQRQYEAIENVPLTVHFVGNIEADNLATVIPALLAQDLQSKPLRYHFVDRSPHGTIADAIAKKATELTRYKESAGYDIRLLLIADQISNSGKLRLDDGAQFDFHGFKAVYLFPYPEDVMVLESAANT